MQITVNGEARQAAPDATILTLIESLGLNPKTTVAQHNDDVVQQQDHGSTPLADGDVIELVRFVGGG